MSRSLLDLMPKQEAEKARENAKKRLERQMSRKGLDVSPEMYLVSEFGYYYGWDAVLAIRRGYTIEPVMDSRGNFVTDKEGNIRYHPSTLTLEEAQLMLEGARKVWYSKITEQTHAQMIGNSFKTTSKSFSQAVKPFTDKAEVKE